MRARRRLFVPLADIQGSVDRFLARYGARISQHTAKISQYAEIAAYNAIISFYESMHYAAKPEQTDGAKFKYKLQPTGDPRKYSYFSLSKGSDKYSVLNNISIESAHVERHYFTGDIVITDDESFAVRTKEDNSAIGIRRSTFSIPNGAVRTFIEVKNMAAFPELLFQFSGLLFEIMPDIFFGKVAKRKQTHLAPSLVCSFAGSGHAMYIRRTLLKRWHINIFVDFLTHRSLDADDVRLISSRRLKFKALTG
jgi:hypothetical protein